MDVTNGLPEHVRENIALWDREAARYVPLEERAWAGEPTWGMWGVAEDECPLLPRDCSGLDVGGVEFCPSTSDWFLRTPHEEPA